MPSLLTQLVCRDCAHAMPPDPLYKKCDNCGSAWLEADYDFDTAKKIWSAGLRDRDTDLWRYEELLPVSRPDYRVSMGEGWTPLIHAANLEKELKLPHIFIKDERQGPTSSFKDRQAAVGAAALIEANKTECVLASTGNKAAAYAAYCARAGIRLWIFLTSMVPNEKLRELGLYGAEVVKIAGTYDQAKKVAADFAERRNLYLDPGTTAIPGKEGLKTVAFEIAEQLARYAPTADGKWRAPDWYIQAVSGGIGPIGIWKGFQELYRMGLIDKMPKLGIIQVEGCSPMVAAWKAGKETAEPVVPRTRISVLATGDPGRGYTILRQACLETGGTMIAANDGAAFRAMRRLARVEGMSMEPAASVAFAGLEQMAAEGILKPDDFIVVNCSGHTFPAEKHVLEDEYVLDLQLGNLEGENPQTTKIEEGLGAALERLDEQVTTVVIIDDNPQDSRLIRRLLQNHKNYRVFEANNPLDGLDLVKQRKPDLVVSDLTMPEMDGFTLLESLKSDPETRDIPVVVVSAKTLTPRDRSMLEGRVESLWQKGSFNTRELVDHVVSRLGSTNSSPDEPIKTTVGEVANSVVDALEAVSETKVLVIDDNRRDARLVRRILEATHRYQVLEAYTGQDAKTILDDNMPRLIVLDLMLPDTDGMTLLKEIKANERLTAIPVVVLTAKELSEEEKKVFRENNCTVWVKPSLDRQALVAHVDKIISEKDAT
jgi:threonine synthase